MQPFGKTEGDERNVSVTGRAKRRASARPCSRTASSLPVEDSWEPQQAAAQDGMLTVKRATVEGGPLLSERQALAIDSRPLSLSCQNRALSRRLLLAVLLLQLPGCLASSMLAEAAHQSEMQAASRGPSNTTSWRSQTNPPKPASRHLVAYAWIHEHWK